MSEGATPYLDSSEREGHTASLPGYGQVTPALGGNPMCMPSMDRGAYLADLSRHQVAGTGFHSGFQSENMITGSTSFSGMQNEGERTELASNKTSLNDIARSLRHPPPDTMPPPALQEIIGMDNQNFPHRQSVQQSYWPGHTGPASESTLGQPGMQSM